MRVKILGFTDSHDQCDRCGKTGLKGTYAVELDNGETYYMGSVCVGKAYQMKPKRLKKEISKLEKEVKQAWDNHPVRVQYLKYLQDRELPDGVNPLQDALRMKESLGYEDAKNKFLFRYPYLSIRLT